MTGLLKRLRKLEAIAAEKRDGVASANPREHFRSQSRQLPRTPFPWNLRDRRGFSGGFGDGEGEAINPEFDFGAKDKEHLNNSITSERPTIRELSAQHAFNERGI
jgi:hypothetical protein